MSTRFLIDYGKQSNIPKLKRKIYCHGYCFNCGSAHHVQQYCPLSLCSKCDNYGHNMKVCKKRY